MESSWGQRQSGREAPCNSFSCEHSGSPGLTAISPLAMPCSSLICIGIWPELRLWAEPSTAGYSSLSSAKSQSPKASHLCLQLTDSTSAKAPDFSAQLGTTVLSGTHGGAGRLELPRSVPQLDRGQRKELRTVKGQRVLDPQF